MTKSAAQHLRLLQVGAQWIYQEVVDLAHGDYLWDGNQRIALMSFVAPSAPTRTLMLAVFTLLYAVSCALPALYLEGQATEWYGFYLLVVGAMGVKYQQFSWFANVAALLGLIACMKGGVKRSRSCSAVAFFLGLHALTLFGKTLQLSGHELDRVRVVELGLGYYAWLLALISPAVLSFLPMELSLTAAASAAETPEED
jgi:hypothetical protein